MNTLRRWPLWVLLVAFAVLSTTVACVGPFGGIRGSGHLATRDYPISGFTAVSAATAFQITIAQSSTFRVRVTADDNIIDQAVVQAAGGTLELSGPPHTRLTRFTLRAEIQMPELDSLRLNAASHATVSGLTSDKHATANLSAASRLDGDWSPANLDLSLSGASAAQINGHAHSLILDVGGASRACMGEFAVSTANVAVSGASTATVNASDTISPVHVSGASTLNYIGNPRLETVDVTGASRLNSKTSGAC